MNQTVIPEVDLKNVKPEEALEVWSQASRSYHPQHFEFRYVVSYPMTYSMQPTKTGGSPMVVSAAAPQNTTRVTVRRKNITSKRLLDEVCRQSKLSWTIMGRVIVVKPRGLAPDTQP